MRVELTEVLWLEEHAVSLSELAELSGLSMPVLEELVSSGSIEPIDVSSAQPLFGAAALSAARQARRLLEDFDLDTSGLSLALGLLERIQTLEQQLRSLQARLPGPIR